MDKFINQISNNISSKVLNSASNELPSALAQIKQLYGEFSTRMNKSDFSNSPQRYVMELSYIRQIKKLALSHNIAKEAEEMLKLEQEVAQKLKNEFGIEIKD